MIKKVGSLLCLFVFAFTLSGCALLFGAAAGGAGTAYWLSGKLSNQVNASYDRAIEGTKMALSSLKMKVTKETRSEEITQIKSEYNDGREVWIDLRPVTYAETKIDIRVGIKGDKTASEKVFTQIKRHL